MNYQTFKNIILERLSFDIPDPKHITLQTIFKNNGVLLDGLVILEDDCNIAPTLYLNYYYDHYKNGDSFQNIYNKILEDYQTNKATDNIDISFYTDFKNTRSKLAFKLIHYEKNRALLKEIPFLPFLDLAIVFYCLIPMDSSIGNATILVRTSHLEFWGVTVEELFEIAKENAFRIMPPQLRNLNSFLKDFLPPQNYPSVLFPDDPLYPMYILTNEQNMFGAACILYDDLIRSFADQFHSDFYILPSSVHEVLLIPVSENNCMEEFSSMVQEVNQTQVADEEILSDHAYYYSHEQDKILT